MYYNFNEIEAKWQKIWADRHTFKAENNSKKEKFYVLDMFPYPSGAGLHVGHPLGYIASDIYARYKRHKGFNVLHPMGYDSFGLPAEQYAIQTGQHPADTTKVNIEGGVDKEGKVIEGYRKQLDRMGFSFDWSREVRTSDPKYYKWTQWIFIQLFNSWYCKEHGIAFEIRDLVKVFEESGNHMVDASCEDGQPLFSAAEWKSYSERQKQKILLNYRLAYLAETEVNWCPALGTVLANDEIVNGVSERGGHPVVRKKMTQWSMRITAYAQRLLDGLEKIDWPQPLKDSQTNWIGRSEGAEVEFKVLPLAPSEGGATSLRLTGDPSIIGLLLQRAKEMRKNPTDAEAKLWEVLRKKDFICKFRRQHPIYKYIVDFVCLEKGLVIEVDGKIHEYQLNQDAERQLVLEEKKGFKVIRFTNDEILHNIEKVKNKIRVALSSRPSRGEDIKTVSSSLPSGGGWGGDFSISVFTTRPDTIFGVSFMTLAPEHELVPLITTQEQKAEVAAYVEATAKRSERDRMADVKTITGVFTGAYAEHPFTKEPIPIWIGDYVLAGYGTGAVMSVPCGDQRDHDFAKHFNIPIPNIFEGVDISEEAFADKEKTIIANSDFLNGLTYREATRKIIEELEKIGQGKGKINYRLRDAVFSRQRYWGEPFPVYYDEDGMPQMLDEKFLPLQLPEVEKYLPTETGEPPLGNAKKWHWLQYGDEGNVVSKEEFENSSPKGRIGGGLELNTMPGWAGSSQYFNRYMDPHNEDAIFSQEGINYWQDVDLYIGGSEHATGHLLYSRFWQKFMFDKGLVPKDEFAKKLINQGMITGTSAFVYVYLLDCYNKSEGNISVDVPRRIPILISRQGYEKIIEGLEPEEIEDWIVKNYGEKERRTFGVNYSLEHTVRRHVDLSLLIGVSDELNINEFRKDSRHEDLKDAIILTKGGKYIVGREVEKMSKSKYNVVSPDAICEEYGADSLRLYEMFLGPLEQSKPWNTAGITGVHSFLKKLWKLYFDDNGIKVLNSEPSADNLKTLHKTIKKVEEDIGNFSFNTSVSTFMICVNELTAQKCKSRTILEPLAILVSPYAPHISEELWEKLGHSGSISEVPFPKFEANYLVENSKEYPISFNGKMRFTLELPLDMGKEEIEKMVMAHEKTRQQLQGRTPKKVIVVPGKIVNIVG